MFWRLVERISVFQALQGKLQHYSFMCAFAPTGFSGLVHIWALFLCIITVLSGATKPTEFPLQPASYLRNMFSDISILS